MFDSLAWNLLIGRLVFIVMGKEGGGGGRLLVVAESLFMVEVIRKKRLKMWSPLRKPGRLLEVYARTLSFCILLSCRQLMFIFVKIKVHKKIRF